jgi:integrase/recombinase XerD
VWESVGRDPELALVALRNVEHDLRSVAIGRTLSAVHPAPLATTTPSPTLSLDDAITTYMEEVRAFKAPKTISACDYMLGEFAKTCKGKRIEQITRADLLAHMKVLNGQSLGDRTVFNHVSRINTMLKANGVVHLLRPSDWPASMRRVDAYNADELAALLYAAGPQDRLLFAFFISTGFREQEVMYCTWVNVDWKGKVISVRPSPNLGSVSRTRKSARYQSRTL